MEDSGDGAVQDGGLTMTLDTIDARTRDVEKSANSFARTMSSAFARSATGAKSFDDVLKSLALRMSQLSLQLALKPVMQNLFAGAGGLLSGLFGGSGSAPLGGGDDALIKAVGEAQPFAKGGVIGAPEALAFDAGAIQPFAPEGVIGTPSYFPLGSSGGGGLGLAGEAGAEAIMPLARGADGKLGVAANAPAAAPNITIHIATPDAASFRRSETHVTGTIARAVARGQRSL